MIQYYLTDGKLCCSSEKELPFQKVTAPAEAECLVWLFRRAPGSCRASFLVNDLRLLLQETESADWVDANRLEAATEKADPRLAAAVLQDPLLKSCAARGTLTAVNIAQEGFGKILKELPGEASGAAETKPGPSFLPAGKKRVNIIAIGDVGSNLLTGLHLLGGDCISEIGICDLSEQVTARWEFEENQIAYPWDYDALPEVHTVPAADLFDCDVVVFVASKGIPPVGSGVKDVRMYQFENNRKIVSMYARQAREKNFGGMFCQVSDPVDPLAKTMFLESNRNADGVLDWKGLRAEQIQGFGLGVMNARAAYYAKRDPRFASFLTEGRTFGPHGEELVVANSVEHYDDVLSAELTHRVVTANLEMRALGFKPFVAPAFSSGALSILLMLRGEWHCGSVYLGGAFMGVKNRYTPYGLETEILPLPEALSARIRAAEEKLKSVI